MASYRGCKVAFGFLYLTSLWLPCLALINDVSGVVNPTDPYIFIGNNLTLTCNLTRRSVYENASNLFFARGREDARVPSRYIRILSPTSIQLHMPVESEEDGGNYVCWLEHRRGSRPTVVGNQIVRVDHAPRPVKNFSCIVHDWSKMNCSWELGQDYIHPDHINVSLIWVISDTQDPCPEMNTNWCVWKRGHHFIPDALYLMKVIVKNIKTGTEAESELIKINSGHIVKPLPVRNLHVSASNSSCMQVSWEPSNSYRVRQFVYFLTYEPLAMEQNGDISHKQVNISEVRGTERTLCGLTPFTTYKVRVAVKPIPTSLLGSGTPKGFMSEWTSVINQTKESVPVKAPAMHPGGYMQTFCTEWEKCRIVRVYWKPVDKKYLHGELTGYTLKRVPLGRDGEETTENLPVNVLYKELMVRQDQAYQVSLLARTRLGQSTVNSSIIIPMWESDQFYPQDVAVEVEENAGAKGFHVHWKPPASGKVHSYTVYWCHGDRASFKCLGQGITWIPLSPNQTSTKIDIKDSKNPIDSYLLGVSAEVETAHGDLSSGIAWGKCNFIKGKAPNKPPTELHIASYSPDKGLTVEWDKYDCAESRSYISHYLLHYCPVDVHKSCTEPFTNVSVTSGQTSYVIESLQPGKKYRVIVEALSPVGKSPPGEVYYIVKKSNTDGEQISSLGLIIGGLFLVIVLIVGFLILIRKVWARKKDNMAFAYADKPDKGKAGGSHGHHYEGRPLPPTPSTPPFSPSHSGSFLAMDLQNGLNTRELHEHMYEKVPYVEIRKDGRGDSVDSESSLINNMEKTDCKFAPPRGSRSSGSRHPSSRATASYIQPGDSRNGGDSYIQSQSDMLCHPPHQMSPPIPIPQVTPRAESLHQGNPPLSRMGCQPLWESVDYSAREATPLACTPMLREEASEYKPPSFANFHPGFGIASPASRGYTTGREFPTFRAGTSCVGHEGRIGLMRPVSDFMVQDCPSLLSDNPHDASAPTTDL